VNGGGSAIDLRRAAGSLLPLGLILLGSAALRLIFLDYSHFQGDEVQALYPIGVPFPESLLEQLKGPVQLLITGAVHALTGGYGEWETRLPFSLASLLEVYVIYRLTRDAFGRRPALWAAALAGSCGLLVAFGRIVQYQAFVMLAVTSSALFLIRWVQQDRPRFLYFGMVCFALAVLGHYDALTFLPALLLLLVLGFLRPEQRTRERLRHLLLAGLLAAAIVGLFYIPFVFRPGFTSVARYLSGRVASGLGWDTFERTTRLLALYFPPLYLPVVGLLSAIGLVAALGHRFRPFGFVVLVWFSAPFAFYMLLGGQPRSHVYTYVLPAMILAALGIETMASAVRDRIAGDAVRVVLWAAIAVSGLATFYMLVDHTVEHPWQRKTLLGGELPNLVTDRIQGVFGFPYRRGLDRVGEMFRSGRVAGTFDSNERDLTVDFYFDAERSSPPAVYFDDAGSVAPDYYFYVLRPFSLRRELPETVEDTYRLVGTIEENGRTTIEVYAAPWAEP
jgi:hypothetical protein